MATITEARKEGTGTGKFFTAKEIVGIPFEITDDKNASSDFPETEKKEGKKGVWLIINIKMNGEEKPLHLTNSALRALRDALPPGIATWRGQCAVMNQDAKGFNPAKFTRLAGIRGAEMPISQTQLGQVPPVATPTPPPPIFDPILTPILDKLRYGSSFFTGGLIPFENVVQTCVTPENFQALKDKGLIAEPKQGFFRVV